MIIGIGNDIIDIRRIQGVLERKGHAFEARCFTEAERAKARKAGNIKRKASVYAKRFAAKEACAKALGTGFANGVIFRDIGVYEDENGRPLLTLNGPAQARLNALIPGGMRPILHLSFSDDYPLAQAFVVIEAGVLS